MSLWQKMIGKISESISVTEQFVYTAGFLAPTLYLLWEKFREDQDNLNPNSKETPYEKLQSVMKVYRGYGWVLMVSVFILALTAIGFSFLKTEAPNFGKSFLFQILTNWSAFIYCFSLYAFYLSIVQDYGPDGEYNDEVTQGENKVIAGLGQRVNKGKDNEHAE